MEKTILHDVQSECVILRYEQPIRSISYRSMISVTSTRVPFLSGPVSLLSLWTNRITQANSRKHQEFAGRLNSVNNKAELYQHLKEENGCVDHHLFNHMPCDPIYPYELVIWCLPTFFFSSGWMFMRTEKLLDDVWIVPLLI